MPDFPKLPIITPPPRQEPRFPDLPILEPDPPRMTLREKYGGLYYLGIGGLVLSLFLVGNFFYQAYRTRDLWAAILLVGNPTSTAPVRVESAWVIARHPDANDSQKLTLALQTELPDLARYILAEGMSAESIQADPKAYALMAAKSDPWPDWLRLMVARPMAYAVGEGYRIPWEPLDEMRGRSDKALGLWMTYTRAVMGPGEATILDQLRASAEKPGAYQDLARLLSDAAAAQGPARVAKLDEATAWLRGHHPPCAQVWQGWEVRAGQVVATGPHEVTTPPPTPAAGSKAGPSPTPAGRKAPPR